MSEPSSESDSNYSHWKHDVTVAAGAGIAAASVIGLGTFAMGRVGETEARVLLESMLPTSRFLCSAIMTAAATILALMLTLLAMTVSAEKELDETFYHRVKQIAFYDMLLLILATCFLVLHCVPLTKSDTLPAWWYPAVYYSLLGLSATMGGAMVAVVSMLYATLANVIQLLGIGD